MNAAEFEPSDPNEERSPAYAQKRRERVEKAIIAARQLLLDEGIDAAVILVTFNCEDSITSTLKKGLGNYYAQYGLVSYIYEKLKAEAISEQFMADRVNTDGD